MPSTPMTGDRFGRQGSAASRRQFEALLVEEPDTAEVAGAAASASDDAGNTLRELDGDVESPLREQSGSIHPRGGSRRALGQIGGRSKLMCAAVLVTGTFVGTTAFLGSLTARRRIQAPVPVPSDEALVRMKTEEKAVHEDQSCHDAKDGEQCYEAVDWAMVHGINEHPRWYRTKANKMLTKKSTFSDFQAFLHQEGRGGCHAPCTAGAKPAKPPSPKPSPSPKMMIMKTHQPTTTPEPTTPEPPVAQEPEPDPIITTESSKAEETTEMAAETTTVAETTTTLPECAASDAEDCTASKCCKVPGMQCYSKNPYWASCRESCIKGPRTVDPDPSPWECDELGPRTPGDPPQCAADNADCLDLKCCQGTGMQCYHKNSSYAVCKSECTPGPDLTDQDWKPWSCKPVGPQKPGPAKWVTTKCSADGADCTHTGCCSSPGKACFEKQPNAYAACKETCTPGTDPNEPWDKIKWTCSQLGEVTPRMPAPAGQSRGQVAPWVEARCSGEQDDCSDSRCCKAVNHQCLRKNEYWSQCEESCPQEKDPKTNETAWSCEVLGPRSWGLATKGFPALFCLSVMRVTGYEPGLMRAQLSRGLGIFACDGFLVVANGNISLGYLPGSKALGNITTWPIPTIPVGRSQDGTAANTLLFMKVWDAVLQDGRYRNYDWTIKADPDAVVMATRLRLHLNPHNGEKVYFVNCNAYPNSPNFPMMYGSLEVYSRLAMLAYAQGSGRCGSELPWKAWGEDYFMTHCLDMLGVGRVGDFTIIGDNVCAGANCASGWTAAFHPFKTVESWTNCLNTALATESSANHQRKLTPVDFQKIKIQLED